MRAVLRLVLNSTIVLLLTFMIAFPAELMNASYCDAVTKL
jgi:hypothetical protein